MDQGAKPKRKLGRIGCGVVIASLILLGVIGAVADGGQDKRTKPGAGPAPGPSASASGDGQAAARATFVANYRAVLAAAKPCDAMVGGLEAAAKSGSPLTMYQAAKAGQEACETAWSDIRKIEPAPLEGAAADKEKDALKTCGTAYFLRQRAMETAMKVADGDAKPSMLSSFQEDMQSGQAAVLMCVGEYMQAAEPAGVKLDKMKI
ncbi:hypothetical protein KV697_06050 [Sphingomonas sanguinis]|uniref:hypothetical protein n=1 Tax=Sphingomonas sanguinis TaxID=33051 RepID=UPI001C56E5DE|nr:hypothetical protein [Sphingomonas sanguinis]QXT36861.1 hypothetical protein KV697_06050 [Sphingomonas sanguinis]